jgi:hypothetical protein
MTHRERIDAIRAHANHVTRDVTRLEVELALLKIADELEAQHRFLVELRNWKADAS